MKTLTTISLLLASLAAAFPVEDATTSESAFIESQAREKLELTNELDLSGRDLSIRASITENQLTQGPCRDVTFIFARGSTEIGNLGSTVGLSLANALQQQFPSIAIQGVNYAAGLSSNFIGGDPQGIAEMTRLWNLAATKCPNTIIVGGGYSQGAALTHRSVPGASPEARNRIAGIVTFGDTYNQQSGGTIEGLPKEKLMVICNPGDLVCRGTLIIAAPHLDYVKHVPEAARFLAGKINQAKAARK